MIKITFLGDVKTAVRSGIKFRFDRGWRAGGGSMGVERINQSVNQNLISWDLAQVTLFWLFSLTGKTQLKPRAPESLIVNLPIFPFSPISHISQFT